MGEWKGGGRGSGYWAYAVCGADDDVQRPVKSPPGGWDGRPEWGLVLDVDGSPGGGRRRQVSELLRRYRINNRKIRPMTTRPIVYIRGRLCTELYPRNLKSRLQKGISTGSKHRLPAKVPTP